MLKQYKAILEKTQNMVLSFAKDVLQGYDTVVEASKNGNIEKADEARALLKDAHKRDSKIDNEIIKTLALFSPEAKDLRIMIAYLKISSELARISDYIRSYAKKVKMQISGEFEIESLKKDLTSFLESTRNSLKAAIDSIEVKEEEREKILEKLYREVHVEESKCDDIISILEKNLLQHICLKPENAEDLVQFIKGIRKLERISDRSVNIVKLTYFAHKGGKL